MKRMLGILLLAGLLFGLTGCTSTEPGPQTDTDDSEARISIVAATFPEYDWVREILGEQINEVDLRLLCSGVDLHSYQPSIEDMMDIAACDLFIYVGGESDDWAEDALSEGMNPDRRVISLMEVLGSSAREEEHVEGMKEEAHEHAHEGDAHEEEEEPELDEHVWLSLRNAQVFVTKIADELSLIDPEHAEIYAANAAAYNESLKGLDEEYQVVVRDGRVKTVLFGDRFPFLYLVKDYDLSYYAAFAGCSAEAEASFETIAFLAEKVNELNLHTILRIEGDGNRIAGTIAQNTAYPDTKVAVMDSMQGTNLQDIADGVSYLSIMQENLSVLKEALE